MVASRPVFLVTTVKNVTRANPGNFYTGMKDRIDCWRVQFIHGFFAGVQMEFFFPDKPSADEFNEWQVYNPSQILAQMQPTEPYTIQAVEKTKWYGQINRYTDKPDVQDSWVVQMESASPSAGNSFGRGGRAIHLRYPDPATAGRYRVGQTTTPQDILGTLPAMPMDVSDQLTQLADAAKSAQEEADYAKSIADGEQLALDQIVVKARADAAAAKTAAAKKAAADAAAAAKAKAAAAAHYTTLQAYTIHPGAQTYEQWWITNGGGAGSYWQAPPGATILPFQNPSATSYVHYASGTFSNPYNGIFYGDFQPDVIPAGVTHGGTGFLGVNLR